MNDKNITTTFVEPRYDNVINSTGLPLNTNVVHGTTYVPNTNVVHGASYVPNTNVVHGTTYVPNTNVIHGTSFVPNTNVIYNTNSHVIPNQHVIGSHPVVETTTITKIHHDPKNIKKEVIATGEQALHVNPSKHNKKHKHLEKHYARQAKKVRTDLNRSNSSSSSSSCSSCSSSGSKDKKLNKEERLALRRKHIRELTAFNHNNICSDCGVGAVNWVDLTFGVFLCLECAKVHKKEFPDFIDRIKSMEVNNFKDKEFEILKHGGNDAFTNFLGQYGINSRTPIFREKYFSKAAVYYIANLRKVSRGKIFKGVRPGLQDGLILCDYSDIQSSLGFGSKLKDKTKNLLHIKNTQTKIADEKMCDEIKGKGIIGNVNVVPTNHTIFKH